MNPSIPIFLALAESESETVAKYESQLESQLESNREFHSRQINRLRGEIDQKQKQIDNLREKNTEISSETDRLKVSYLDVKTIKLTKNYSVRIFCSSNKRPRKRRKIDHFDKEGRKKWSSQKWPSRSWRNRFVFFGKCHRLILTIFSWSWITDTSQSSPHVCQWFESSSSTCPGIKSQNYFQKVLRSRNDLENNF